MIISAKNDHPSQFKSDVTTSDYIEVSQIHTKSFGESFEFVLQRHGIRFGFHVREARENRLLTL
jgi:hypothetical protein